MKEEYQKPTKKAKVVKTATSNVQKEVAKLSTSDILPTRTRGGASTRVYPAQPPKKPQKQPKRATRKLVLSKYIEEEDIAKKVLELLRV